MKEEKLRREIRFHEGFPYVYIVLSPKCREGSKRSVKILEEVKHSWSREKPDSSEKPITKKS